MNFNGEFELSSYAISDTLRENQKLDPSSSRLVQLFTVICWYEEGALYALYSGHGIDSLDFDITFISDKGGEMGHCLIY